VVVLVAAAFMEVDLAEVACVSLAAASEVDMAAIEVDITAVGFAEATGVTVATATAGTDQAL
jgi:hypothetical protein